MCLLSSVEFLCLEWRNDAIYIYIFFFFFFFFLGGGGGSTKKITASRGGHVKKIGKLRGGHAIFNGASRIPPAPPPS